MEIRFLIRSSREPKKTGRHNGRSLYKWNPRGPLLGKRAENVVCAVQIEMTAIPSPN